MTIPSPNPPPAATEQVGGKPASGGRLDAGNDGLADRLEKEPLADELFRLIDEWNDAPFESSEREEAWNLIADCVTEAPNAKAILAALRASDTNAREVWQPIEMAPKDGTTILLFCPSKLGAVEDHQTVGWWSVEHSARHDWEEWSNVAGDFLSPSDWQPLPPPPLRRAAGEGESPK